MIEHNNILACFVSDPPTSYEYDEEMNNKLKSESPLFRKYIWGEEGIDQYFKQLYHSHYGSDVELILFQFYPKPHHSMLPHLQRIIGNYRKSEKSFGINIIIDDDFFTATHSERYVILKKIIFNSLDLLAERIKKKKLDTDISKLKSDLQKILMDKV